MWFLSRPPFLRWIAAGCLIAAAFVWDLSERSTEPFPFASLGVEAGTAIDESQIEWRSVPVGSISLPDLESLVALVDIEAGDPITRSVAGTPPTMPEGWWAVPMRLPANVIAGTEVRLVLVDGTSIDAVVSSQAVADEFGGESVGAVAVPEDVADLVAVASAADAVAVLARP